MFRRDFFKLMSVGSVGIGATAATSVGFAATVQPSTNARASIQEAIDEVSRKGGGTVLMAAGEHRLDGELVIATDRIRLVGESRATVLKATQKDITLIHFAASHGGVKNLSLSGGVSGVTALRVEPRLPTPADRTVHQNYNRFSNLYISGCAEGITLQAGSNVPERGDCGCWYNVFETILIIYTQRGVWLKSPVGDRGSSVNRNQFYSVRIGQFVNTGVQIDSGDTNSFVGCSFEGINKGKSPNATPTAILVKRSASSGADNNHNTFVCNRFEGNSLDLENHNGYTELFSSSVAFGQDKFRGVNPLFVVGGSDPSFTPTILPGMTISSTEVRYSKKVVFEKGATDATRG